MAEIEAAPGARRFYALRGMRDNVYVNDVPRNTVTRAAKLAGLPIGLAGRTALGVGKRIGGRPAEIVAEEIQRRTADQIFRVLGELKGGAMKLGQALSIFEAALPPEIAGPYRATLTRLQESAPPLPARTVHQVLARDLGEAWRDSFASFDDAPAAAASIGQVHQAVWHDGRRVAVKIQYPGAGRALISDFTQLSRAGRLFGLLMPGLDVKPLLDELRDRVAEELDYWLEAARSARSARRTPATRTSTCRRSSLATGQVLVTEWMDGTPLSRIISDGSKETARPGRRPAHPVPVLRPGAGRAAARGPAPGQLPAARRRPAGRARLRRGGPAAGRAAAVPGPPAAAHAPGRAGHLRGRAGTARPRVPAAGHRGGPGGSARLPGAAGRAVQGGLVQVQPRVAARRGGPRRRHQYRQHHPQVQPAPVLRAHPPHVHGRHRRAVPAGVRRRVPGRGAAVDAGLLRRFRGLTGPATPGGASRRTPGRPPWRPRRRTPVP